MSKKKEQVAEGKDAVLLLRFRTTEPSKNAYVYCTYLKISKIVNLTYN